MILNRRDVFFFYFLNNMLQKRKWCTFCLAFPLALFIENRCVLIFERQRENLFLICQERVFALYEFSCSHSQKMTHGKMRNNYGARDVYNWNFVPLSRQLAFVIYCDFRFDKSLFPCTVRMMTFWIPDNQKCFKLQIWVFHCV